MNLLRTSSSPPSRIAFSRPVWVLLLLLAVLATYLPAMTLGRFHYDDGHHVVGNTALHVDPYLSGEPPEDASLETRARYPGAAGFTARVTRLFTDAQTFSSERGVRMYRPVLMTSYAIDSLTQRGLSRLLQRPVSSVRISLLTNTLLHALVAILVAFLAVRIGLPPLAGLLAGGCMAVHPVFSEALNYVSSRSESLAAVWMLIAFHLHLSARGRPLLRALPWAAAAALAALTATLSKETPALFCAAVAWYELVSRRADWKVGLRRAAVWGAFYAVPLAVLLLVRKLMLSEAAIDLVARFATVAGDADPQTGGGRSIVGNLLLQMRVCVLYLQLLVRPVQLSIEHGVVVVGDHLVSTVVAILIHGGIAAAAICAWWRRTSRLPLLLVGWFWLFLAPSIIVPLNVVMNEHRLYLPGIAVALAVGAFLARVADRLAERGTPTPRAVATAVLPLMLFVPLSVSRSLEWRDDEALWASAVRIYPESARAQLHLGAAIHEQAQALPPEEQLPQIDRALGHYLRSEELHPTWLNLQLDLGNLWLMRARLTRADSDFEHSIAAFDAMGRIAGAKTFRWRLLKATGLLEWKRLDEAEAMVRQLDAEDDSVTPLYDDLLARVLRDQGRLKEASAAMDRVIAISDRAGQVEAQLTIGWWHMEAAIDGKREGRPPQEFAGLLKLAEARIGKAHEMIVAEPGGNFRPKLYIARFLHFMGQPGGDEFLEGARKMGWTSGDADLRWVRGGRTPNVPSGTYGVGRVVPR